LVTENATSGAETVVCTIEVDCANVVPILNAVVETSGFGGNASIRDDDIETAEIRDYLCDCRLDLLVIANVDLVGLDLDAEVTNDCRGELVGVL
jgi:hypothetical protein